MRAFTALAGLATAVAALQDALVAHRRPTLNSTALLDYDLHRMLETRADYSYERCVVSCYGDQGGCSSVGSVCLQTGSRTTKANVLWTIGSGVSFLECQKEGQRNPAAHSTSWTNGACTIYSDTLQNGISFQTSTTTNVGTIWNNVYCFQITGLCLLHANSFEPAPQNGVIHPWEIFPSTNKKNSIMYTTNQQATLFKPTPSGKAFLRVSLQSNVGSVVIAQIVALDNTSPQTYTVSYSYIFQSYKVNSGRPARPNFVTVEINFCGTRVDLFSIYVGGAQNTAWQTRTASNSMPVCTNEFVRWEVSINTDSNAAAGDYQITMGFDNFQYNP